MHKVYFVGLFILRCDLNSYSQTPVSPLQQLRKSVYATYPVRRLNSPGNCYKKNK